MIHEVKTIADLALILGMKSLSGGSKSAQEAAASASDAATSAEAAAKSAADAAHYAPYTVTLGADGIINF